MRRCVKPSSRRRSRWPGKSSSASNAAGCAIPTCISRTVTPTSVAVKGLVDRPRQRNLLLVGLGGVGMMGLSFAQAMFKQKISVADLSPAAREAALKNGADVAYDPSEAEIIKRMIKETEGGFDEIVDFAGNEKSMAFAVSAVARGGKIVVSGLMGGNFSLPMVQWIDKRLTIEGFMVGTLAKAHEVMTLARAVTVQ